MPVDAISPVSRGTNIRQTSPRWTEQPEPAAGTTTDADQAKMKRAQAQAGATLRATLTPDQQRVVAQLQNRDAEVRAHEAAHQAVGGALAGGASFSYQTGPDGRRYAIGGEVPVNLSSGRTPQETIQRMQQVKAAALAPANPSSADLAIAAAASQMAAQAQTEMSRLAGEQRASEQEQRTSQAERSGQDRPTAQQAKATAAYRAASAVELSAGVNTSA